ncbi:unnamed protein product [Lactuca virosa]|uniref:DUF7026 domain-containing protein n=1 Tax=Lactuca virosa TaxID=75947 RepID=A0AAU9PKD6_9ASTR|nr:unnamed protein product [Lactuca virosa]
MALIRVHVHLLPGTHPLRFTNFQTHPSLHCNKIPPKLRISCSSSNSKSINDMELAMDLSTEIERMKIQMIQTQEAMKTSRKLLYAELCLYLGLGIEELRRKWERMEEDDKWVLAEEFVSDWSSNFHPLSAKSVKQLVDQHLFQDGNDHDNGNNKDNNSSQDSSSSSSLLFSGLKKLMGFPDDK